MTQGIEEKIRERAYEIWMATGCENGLADLHWLSAEQAVMDEAAQPGAKAVRGVKAVRGARSVKGAKEAQGVKGAQGAKEAKSAKNAKGGVKASGKAVGLPATIAVRKRAAKSGAEPGRA